MTFGRRSPEPEGYRLTKRLTSALLGGGWWAVPKAVLGAMVVTAAVSAWVMISAGGSMAAFFLTAALVGTPLVIVSAFVDRRLWPAHELMAWLAAESMAEWRAKTGTRMPVTRGQAERWLATSVAHAAPPALCAGAMAVAQRFAEARAIVSMIPDHAAPADVADRDGMLAQLDFLEYGHMDSQAWRNSVAALARADARVHLAQMAVIEAAVEVGRGGAWQRTLLEAHAAYGPFRVPGAMAAAKWLPRFAVPLGMATMLIVVGLIVVLLGID